MKQQSLGRVLQPFILMVIFIVAVFYFVNVFNTQNWLWFQNSAVNVRPSRILILHDGERIMVQSGHPNYVALADAVERSLSDLNSTALVDIGLSDETLADYAAEGLVLELYFDKPVTFNSMARTGKPTQLLIPIEGRHAGNGLVFLGGNGRWWVGAVRMADPSPLLTALAQLGYTAVATEPVTHTTN
jgi:hypothetical protein